MQRHSLSEVRKMLDDALTFERLHEAKELAQEGYALARSKEILNEMEYFKGEIALIEGKVQTAIHHFDRAIRFNPHDAEAYNDKALAYAEIGNYEQAMEWIDRGLKLNPGYATLYHNKGWFLAQTDKYEDAISFYKKALQLDRKRAVTYICLAEVYEYFENYKLSYGHYKRALSLLSGKHKEVRQQIAERLDAVRQRLK